MEFPHLIPLVELFPDQISIVERDLIPYKSPALKKYGNKKVVEHMTEILDKIGAASAKAQELKTVITSAKTLQGSTGRQVIYLLCDFAKNQVVGLLKIGFKHLFLFDQLGKIHELNPLCVLDFYVHETKQRRGYGKILFDAMLEHEQVDVKHLATDLPSDNLIYFLRKHYRLDYLIPQVNHFAIYDGFFNSRADLESGKKIWHGLDQTPDKENRKVVPKTILQDSRQYNKEVTIHFRNMTHGRFASKVNGTQMQNGNGTVADQPLSSFY